jgi:hypothetical protein
MREDSDVYTHSFIPLTAIRHYEKQNSHILTEHESEFLESADSGSFHVRDTSLAAIINRELLRKTDEAGPGGLAPFIL